MSGVDEKGDFWINDPNDSEERAIQNGHLQPKK